MSKHVFDHSKGSDTARSERYSKIEADQMPRPQTQKLQKRSQNTNQSKRLQEFTEIDRRTDS